MARVFRVALLGCGGVAQSHCQHLVKNSRVDLEAFCDSDISRANHYNRQFRGGAGKEYSDPVKMFDEVKPDVVWVCLPPYAHNGQVEAAAERGIHIFMEEPMALDMDRASSMVAAVEKAKIKCAVGLMHRYGAAALQLKGAIDNGSAGAPGVFQARLFCNDLHKPWWRDKQKSGGQILEQLIHTYDLARFLFGPVRSIYACAGNLHHKHVDNYTSDDSSACVISFKNGSVASIVGSNGAIPGQILNDFRVVTQFITADFKDSNNAVFHHTRDPHNVEKTIIESSRNWYAIEGVNLLDAIEHGTPVHCPIHEGAKTQRLVLAAYESAEKHQPVELDLY